LLYFQIGPKQDETGFEVYDTCRRFGALVMTGHDHSYARTFLMSDFANFTIASREPSPTIVEGSSVVLLSGVGGQEPIPADPSLITNPWW
jgi:hypothetical protein